MSETIPVVRRTKIPAATSTSGVDGQTIQNRLLMNLPRAQSSKILLKAQAVSLPVHTVLNHADEAIQFVYFINTGLASILTVLKNGKSVEVGLTGKEGFVGLLNRYG